MPRPPNPRHLLHDIAWRFGAQPQLRHHVEGRLVTDALLLRRRNRLPPALGEFDDLGPSSHVHEARVEVAVQQRVTIVARHVDAIGGDGDVGGSGGGAAASPSGPRAPRNSQCWISPRIRSEPW